MYASYIYSSVLHIEFQNENNLVNINKPQGSFYGSTPPKMYPKFQT